MKSVLILILATGCLPFNEMREPSVASPQATIQASNCKTDSIVHGVGVIGAASGALTSLGFAWASLEVSPTGNAPQTLANVGLIAGGVGLAAVGLIVIGALDYAADKCAGPLPTP
jgi:hypothetical protein